MRRALVVALAGCAAQPPSRGPVKDITPLQALEKDAVGDQVRWGGPILTVEPKQDKTCFRMLSFFLGGHGEPHLQNQHQGHWRVQRATTKRPSMLPGGP